MFATEEGMIKLDNDLVLSNVIYVLGLACILIFVSQIVDTSNYIAAFSKQMCVLHDYTSMMLVGMGEREDRLYYFWGKLQI